MAIWKEPEDKRTPEEKAAANAAAMEKAMLGEAWNAYGLLEKPENIDLLKGKYVIILTTENSKSNPFDVLTQTINLMATKGWKCNNLTPFKGNLLALMEKVVVYDGY